MTAHPLFQVRLAIDMDARWRMQHLWISYKFYTYSISMHRDFYTYNFTSNMHQHIVSNELHMICASSERQCAHVLSPHFDCL